MIPQRKLRVTVEIAKKNGKSQFVSFDETFHIIGNTQESADVGSSNATITIKGALARDMYYLATSGSTLIDENSYFNKIIVEAGYSDRFGVIYDGQINNAVPDFRSADFSITFLCGIRIANRLTDTISKSFKGPKPVRAIVKEICDHYKVAFYDGIDTDDIIVTDYSLSNALPEEHFRKIKNEASGEKINITTGTYGVRLIYVGSTKGRENLIERSINPWDVIGSPVPTFLGCDFDSRINPSLRGQDPIKITSLRFPEMNGERYYIQTLSHVFDTRGEAWMTKVNAVKHGTGYVPLVEVKQ